MGYATPYIEDLRAGKTISFRPKGNSMTPLIKSKQLCTIEPVKIEDVKKGDIILCKVNGNEYLHLCTAVQGDRIQISNNHGHVNGWTGANGVYGRLIKVEP